MRLTNRDRQLIQLISECRLLTAKQIQLALFPLKHDSRCQLRLTLLKRHRYIDHLPNRLVNQPAVYLLSRKNRVSFDLLREYWDDDTIRSYMIAPGSVQHLLGINDVRVRVLRACQELGYQLVLWKRSEDLAELLQDDGLIPDAYFKVSRMVDGQPRTSAFFLELQRANKSKLVLKSKLDKYNTLYNSGRFQRIFETRALRVLFVFTSEYGVNIKHRIRSSIELAQEQNLALIRSTALDEIKKTG